MAILNDKNYVDMAEKAVQKIAGGKLTTTKLRNLLSLTSALYDEAQHKDFELLQDRIAYLRVQFVYQSGREPAVKELVEEANILSVLKEVEDKESLVRFCRYMEAIVAYFKYYGGRD